MEEKMFTDMRLCEANFYIPGTYNSMTEINALYKYMEVLHINDCIFYEWIYIAKY